MTDGIAPKSHGMSVQVHGVAIREKRDRISIPANIFSLPRRLSARDLEIEPPEISSLLSPGTP